MKRISPFKTLDIFRGFAALWVVMVHSCDRWLFDGHTQYLHQPLYAFSMYGPLGVVLFFIISGYCITAAAYSALVSGKSIWRYGYERIRRIYPPYLAALVLTVISLFAIQYANNHHLIGQVHHLPNLPPDPKYWFANVFLLQLELKTDMVNLVFWSLCYEVCFYFVIGLFLQASKWIAAKRNLSAATIFFVSCFGVSTALGLISMLFTGAAIFPFELWHQFSLGGLLFFVMELKPDTVSGYTQGLRRVVLGNTAVVVGLTIAFIAYCQVGMVDAGHPSSKVRSALCLLFSVFLMGIRRIDERIATHKFLRPMMWLGAFSYSLYLTHLIVTPYVDILGRKGGFDGQKYVLTFLAQIVVAVVFGRLFYRLVEKRFISKRQVQRLADEHVA